jgi:hypothetical protein
VEARYKVGEELTLLHRRRIRRVRQRHIDREQPLGPKPGIDRVQRNQRANQHPGSQNEHERQADLRDDEGAASAGPIAAG